ncbi:MAG: uridine kinase [Myxococcota bacterium]|jgi:uridine kinase
MTFILGMAGGTASGKTTLAAALGTLLGSRALLITHDQYYKTLPAEFGRNPIGYNFDHPDSLDTAQLISDIDALKQGETVDLPLFDFSSHSRSTETRTVAPAAIVIVEGILVLANAELRSRFDHSVYVHTPDDLRLVRRIRRDIEKRGRDVHGVLGQWEATVRPMHEEFVARSRSHADTIVHGTDPVGDLVAMVTALLPTA